MKIYPDFETVSSYAREYGAIPLMTEMMADMVTPVNVFLGIKRKNNHCFLLESAENEQQFGRYSIIGYAPKTICSFKDGSLSVTTGGDTYTKKVLEPFTEINGIIKKNISPVIPGLPKFTGGLVGYFGYDTVRSVEPTVMECPEDDLQIPDILLMDCGRIIVFDHLKHRVTLITSISSEGDLKENYNEAEKRLAEMCGDLQPALASALENETDGSKNGKFTVNNLLNREDYVNMVKKAKEAIYEGEIFQVVLSQRFDITNPPDAFKVYRALRADEPSPYMYYISFDEITVVGSSPEKLVSVENYLVTTNPIAGTIKRGSSKAEDEELERKLQSDEKERAEHMMLVDLSRNDLGRICEFGTVNVDKLMQIGHFSKLMHIISQVTGTLKKDSSLLDVLCSCLPAGTLSGAPKIRAMQIIDTLEKRKRCLYGGAIGYIGYNGIMDTCIAIRTALFTNDKAYIQAGAGIVADSIPEAEYEESRTKAAAALNAFEKAGELI